jgi:hypothetical protein
MKWVCLRHSQPKAELFGRNRVSNHSPTRVTFTGSPEYPPFRGHGGVTKKPLASGTEIFPDINADTAQTVKLWKRPAFLVSIGTTALALIAVGVLLITQLTSAQPPTAADVKLASGEVNITVTWNGPNVPYNLILVKADNSAADLTHLIRGRQAFIPKASNLASAGSCLIVRPASIPLNTSVGTDEETLDKQGAAKACL